MYQNQNRGRSPRPKQEWGPNKVMTFVVDGVQVDFHPVDEATMVTFLRNVKDKATGDFKFDIGAFKAVAEQAPKGSFNGGSPVAILDIEGLRSALKPGMELFTGLENDGEAAKCGLCGEQYQPHKRGEFQRGEVRLVGGDIAVVRKDVLLGFIRKLKVNFATASEQYTKDLADCKAAQPADGAPALAGRFLNLAVMNKPEPPVDPIEVINRLSSSVDATMTEFIGEGTPPELAVALPVGFICGCQDRLCAAAFVTFVARESVLAALGNAETYLGSVDDRKKTQAALDVLGARRPQQRPIGAGPSNFRDRRNDRRNIRPQKERINWQGTGAMLEISTAEALTAEGYTLVTATVAANNGELVTKKIAHEGSIGPIIAALERASSPLKPPVSGSASGVVVRQQPAPGADRPGGKKPGAKRGKEFQAPPRRGGKGLSLAQIGGE